ncbi:hypothetical protein [Phytopseudomonas flavescens]|nr:hypothetical protein [Pseudomonas flavescens]
MSSSIISMTGSLADTLGPLPGEAHMTSKAGSAKIDALVSVHHEK